MSLIAFPSRELFQEKLRSFDLMVFDRYRKRGVLPLAYFQNMASYVQDGGALLISSRPGICRAEDLSHASVSQVLPVQPTGHNQPSRSSRWLREDGLAHPVTRELPGRNQGEGDRQVARLGPLGPRFGRQQGRRPDGDGGGRGQPLWCWTGWARAGWRN